MSTSHSADPKGTGTQEKAPTAAGGETPTPNHTTAPARPARAHSAPRPPAPHRPTPIRVPPAPSPAGQAISPIAPPVLTTGWLDAAIRKGDHIETPYGPLPVPSSAPSGTTPGSSPQAEMLLHEKDLLATVLRGPDDQRPLWGLFRRRIGLRFHEAVPEEIWSTPQLRLIAAECDAIFRGQRDVHVLNAEAIRQDLRRRSLEGRWQGCLQEAELALAELLEWGGSASALDFPIACDIFQSAKARQIFYPALERLLERRRQQAAIAGELQECRRALLAAEGILSGRLHHSQPVLSARLTSRQCIELAALPADQRPRPISTGIPSLDLDMRGGILPGHGEGTWVLAARSGIGKTTVAIAAAMGLACNGASGLVFSCELTCGAILSRLLANHCRRALGPTPLYGASDLEGRGRVIQGEDLERLRQLQAQFEAGLRPDGRPMGELHYDSRFSCTVEEFAATVEDAKSAHPDLAFVVLDHFHAMGPSPGYGSNTTAEMAARALAIKALAGRCELDILVVAQLNRGAYGSTAGPDVSHLAGTSELERYASAVWLLERPRSPDGAPPPRGVLEVHHGKFRHGQPTEMDLNRTVIRIDRPHCFLEADDARAAFSGSHLYPGVAIS